MMDDSGRFTDYFFAKMGTDATGGGGTKERSQTPTEQTGFGKWISENKMLLVTLFGVIAGVVLGNNKTNTEQKEEC